MSLFGCASDEQYLDELKGPSISQAKSYCKKALKIFRSSGYAVPELERYYHSHVPEGITLMQVQHCYAVYCGFSNWSEMCKVFSRPLNF